MCVYSKFYSVLLIFVLIVLGCRHICLSLFVHLKLPVCDQSILLLLTSVLNLVTSFHWCRKCYLVLLKTFRVYGFNIGTHRILSEVFNFYFFFQIIFLNISIASSGCSS